MSQDALHQLAERAAISLKWNDYRDQPQQVSSDTLRGILTALGLPCETDAAARASLDRLDAEGTRSHLPPLLTALAGEEIRLSASAIGRARRGELKLEDGGTRAVKCELLGEYAVLPGIEQPGYHRLQIDGGEITLAVAPRRCFGIERLAARSRPWGIAAQLYSLRRKGDGGIGDFTALAEFARQAAQQGADAVAISPAHAQFAADVERFGPYAPSSRLFLNALQADPAALFGQDEMSALVAESGLAAELRALEAEKLVDWPAAARARYRLLRSLYAKHRLALANPDARDPLMVDWRAFRARGGETLEAHARFEALHAHQFGQDSGRWHWRSWPDALRDPRSAEVAAFADAHADEVSFHVFLQWLADRGFADAQAAARAAGMSIGLISDLAVGTDGGGSHAWSRQDEMLVGLSVGAPPDLLNIAGQNWGLTAFSPRALHTQGFKPFIETLRASLRHAGGLRIDHVLGLQRLWLVPEGAPATQGAYLRYPLQDMLRLIALESERHRAVIVGEDLGTVPEGFRDRLDETGILGMRVLWFENQHNLFIEPRRWSSTAMATTSTHDLATVAGWWTGEDLKWRSQLGLFAADSSEPQEQGIRERDRQALWNAFIYAGAAEGWQPQVDQPQRAVDAAIDFVARTPSPLAMVPVEDLLGSVEQLNIPGTTDEHPNWRRRLPQPVESVLDAPEVRNRTAILRKRRGPAE